jgi:RNA polymerase sigma-70 factor, ECF subfamily
MCARAVPSSNDRDFWSVTFDELLPKVLNYFVLKLGNLEWAEDCTSATFERVWQKRRQFDPKKGTVTNWVLAIAGRIAADGARRRRFNYAQLEFDVVDPRHRTPPECVLHNQRRDTIRRAIAELDERERTIIALRYGADATNRSIATTLGLSESNVGTILHRTIGRLRIALEKEDVDETG